MFPNFRPELCKDDFWNGFTHELLYVNTPLKKPTSKIIAETPFAVKKEWYSYKRCIFCGKIFTFVREGGWVWKDSEW